MVVPSWLQKYISENEVAELESRIAQIEDQCDVEIVPVIVRASSSYPQTKITIALLFTTIFVELWYLLGIDWHWDGRVYSILFLGAFLLATLVVAPFLAKFGCVQMFMTHKHVEEEQCWKRSEIEFHSGKVSEAKRDNGVLIYISLLEHRVIVKGDKAIFEKIENAMWTESVQKVIAGMKQKKMAQGISGALDVMESLLKIHFPVESGKHNELANTFIIKE